MISDVKPFVAKSTTPPSDSPRYSFANVPSNGVQLIPIKDAQAQASHLQSHSMQRTGGVQGGRQITNLGQAQGGAKKALAYDADDFRADASLSFKNKLTNFFSKTTLTRILALADAYKKEAAGMDRPTKHVALQKIDDAIQGWQADHDPQGTGLTSAKAQAMVKLEKAVQAALDETSFKSML